MSHENKEFYEVQTRTDEMKLQVQEDQKRIDKLTRSLSRHEETNNFGEMILLAMQMKQKGIGA